ncbi:MAG TPA: HAMP domain-containing sensor histidine kinase [Cryobacterium sp.]|nr:HAMP domain-containing sensor histidine kinase [Cryobacterium sp.]
MQRRLPLLPRPSWSVRVRILASILLVATLGMTVAGGMAYLVQRNLDLRALDARLATSVEGVRFIVTGTPDSAGQDATTQPTTQPTAQPPAAPGSGFVTTREALEAVMARLIPSRNESSVGIINGRPALVPGTALAFRLEDDPAFIQRVVAEAGGNQVVLGTALTSVGALRYIAVPVTVDGSGEEGLFVTAFDLNGELGELNSAFGIYALVAAVALLAMGLVGWVVAGRLLRPIRQLQATASRITATDLQERIPVTGRDDVSELARTINDMLARLDESLTAQRRLMDDVRHELRTPITILRGHLELVDPHNPEDVAATRDLAVDELDRMTGLVDDIASLATAQGAVLTCVPTDVGDLSNQVFQKARGLGGHEWSLAEVAHSVLLLDPARITQAWLQLADNAAKHAPVGTVIELGSTDRDGAVELWVADQGPGIPPAAQKRIFERFGRVDQGRGIAGSGLGLPIVDAIARAHGGHVHLSTSPEGSRFGIMLPRQVSESAEEGTNPE